MINVSLVFIIMIAALFSGKNVGALKDLQTDIAEQMEQDNDRFLSRQRRYLMFPEGSSFQLVFCLTYTSVGVGSYFVFGHTAALAYELPTTPLFFDQRDFQNKDEDTAESTTTEIPEVFDVSDLDHFHSKNERVSLVSRPWIDSDGNMPLKYSKTFFKAPSYYSDNLAGPYSDNFWNYINPTLSALSGRTSNKNTYPKYLTNFKSYRNRNQDNYAHYPRYDSKKSHMSLNMDPKYHQVHRRTRRDLYKKLESVLTRINVDGKSCVLKAICEIRKSSSKDVKGSLIEEIFKAIFKSKPHDLHQDEDDYDAASNPELNCIDMFKTCQGSIKNIQVLARK